MTLSKTRVFIGMGSNLQNPLQQVITATTYLNRLPDTRVCAVSSCYLSPPLGPSEQPDYINRVVALDTALNPEELLDLLQKIEHEQGRVRLTHWGPRVIDLDILLYGTQIIHTDRLTIPHVGLKDRAFFLHPLAEIAPDLILPDGENILELKAACPHPITNIGNPGEKADD